MKSFRTHATLPIQAAIDAATDTLFGIERHMKGIGTFKVASINIEPIDAERADVTTEWKLAEREGVEIVYGAGLMVIG